MILLLIGLVLFLGIHSIRLVAPEFRQQQITINEMRWKGIYSIVSFISLYLIVIGFGEARLSPTPIYQPPENLKSLASLILLPAFVLFLTPYFPGKIKGLLKHPQLVGLILWSIAHLLLNGNLAELILFGSFLIWSCFYIIQTKQQAEKQIQTLPSSKFNDTILLILGASFYLSFIFSLHGALIGIPLF